jgi:hypothetical protein
MSQATNYAENKLIDFLFRAQTSDLPTTWFLALGSAASDSSFTELSGTSYARLEIARSLGTFAGTHGAGTTTISTGTSHSTTNNNALDWPTAGGSWGTANFVGFFDASSGGNCWFYFPLLSPVSIGSSDTFSLAAGQLGVTLGLAPGMSNYLSNKLIDLIFRGQSYTPPTTLYHALFTAAPSNAGGGTEVSGPGYARVGVVSSVTSMSGTQSAGSTTASSGTSGRTGNNSSITFPTVGGSWGTITASGFYDASTGGNLLGWATFSTPKAVASGSVAPSYAIDALGITLL